MGFLSDFWDNACDAADNVGAIFKSAGDAFSDGNILGGLHRGLMGTLSAGGNLITLGGANALGEMVNDDLDSGDPNAVSKAVGYFARNEAESILMQDDLADGKYVEYEYNKKTNTLDIARDSNGNPKITVAQTEEDKQRFRNIMHVMAGVDIAGDVFDVATLGAGGKGVSTVGKVAVKEGVEEATEQAVKQTTKIAVKAGAETVAEETAEQAAKQAAKTVAKEGAEETAEQAAKQAAKTVAKEGAEETAEQAAKQAAKTVAKEGVGAVSEEATKRVTLTGIKNGMKSTAGKGVALFVGSRVINGQTVADAEMHGGAYAAQHAASDVAANGADIAATAAKDVGGFIGNSFLAKFPGLGKFVNTCRAACYATSKSFAHSSLGAGAVAAVVKPFDFIKSKIKDRQGEYFGKGVGDVAKQIHEDSLKDGKSWKDHYVERVSELDKSIGLDPNKRNTVANYDSIGSDKSFEDEPSLA